MKTRNPSYLYFFVLALASQPAFAQTRAQPEVLTANSVTLQQASQKALDESQKELATRNANTKISAAPLLPAQPAVAGIQAATTTAPAAEAHAAATSPASVAQVTAQPTAPAQTAVATQVPPLPPVDYYRPLSVGDVAEVDSPVLAADLEKAGIAFDFNGTQAQLQGRIAGACADNLVMDVVKRAPTAESDDDKDDKAPELTSKYSVVGIRISFRGNEKIPTLAECMKTEKRKDIKDLTSFAKVNKAILDSSEDARLGLMDDQGKIEINDKSPKSDSYKKHEEVIAYLGCSDCKVTVKKVKRAMDALDDQSAVADPTRIALLKKGLEEAVRRVHDADSIRKIEAARDDLLTYAKWVASFKGDSDDLADLKQQVTDGLIQVQVKSGALANSDTVNAGAYANLISKNGILIAGNRYVDKDLRAQQKEVAIAYKKGGSERLKFVSSISPDNAEVRDYLFGGADMIHNAHADAVKKCTMTIRTPAKVDACNQSIAQMQAVQSQIDTLSKNFMTAQALPKELQPNGQNNFAGVGSPPKGSYAVGSAPGQGSAAAINSVYGLNPSVFGNTTAYQPSMMNSYQVQAPNYQNNAGSQFMISNPTVAVPLNQALMPQQQQSLMISPYALRT
jgi:hypothetical protein